MVTETIPAAHAEKYRRVALGEVVLPSWDLPPGDRGFWPVSMPCHEMCRLVLEWNDAR
jgi:hypothetical protein